MGRSDLTYLLILFIGDFNTIVILFLILISTLLVHVNTSLHLLLTAELIWITIYLLTVLTGLVYDNLNILSLSFFVLVFSAVEFGIGLVILLMQFLLTRTLNLNENDNNVLKFTDRIFRKNYLNRINWKF
jgi:NADH:ubiquinone oxidoreductase subunit K